MTYTMNATTILEIISSANSISNNLFGIGLLLIVALPIIFYFIIRHGLAGLTLGFTATLVVVVILSALGVIESTLIIIWLVVIALTIMVLIKS